MISKPPGVEDIFPDRINKWNHIIDTAKNAFRIHNYKELITPVMEYTEVFSRGIGDETDIVSKEMFTFEDRGGRSLTLRPEGTASAVRAYVENGEYNRLATCKFFYAGPMFRAERPQRGRLRQFNQFGAELFGSNDPYYDFEVISMMDGITKDTGISEYSLLINSIGCKDCRKEFIKSLKEYYTSKKGQLCKDCISRLEKNPLRLLDCKIESCSNLKDGAPRITSFLCDDCSSHHSSLKEYLDKSGISYTEDPYLVRGLDYYTRTTFEFVTKKLGGQNAFAAGGRYDNLVEQFEGKPTPGVGFAAGIERIYLLIEEMKLEKSGPDAFVVHTGGDTLKKSIETVNLLRTEGISVDIDPSGKGFKSQFKKADRENAKFAVIIGEDELSENSCILKNLSTGDQKKIPLNNISEHLK